MSGSQAERDIRDAVVAKLRATMQGARIVHELVVNDCRADLAAIEAERVTLVEIKSEKDTLARLARQLSRFRPASHHLIVAAHAKWFEEFDYNSGHRGYRPCAELAECRPLWRYPEPEPGQFRYHDGWKLDHFPTPEPHAARLLGLLWRDELVEECFRHRIATGRRTNMQAMIRDMVWLMTGKEVARAVCRQLRQRPFPEADAAIYAEAAVAA